MRPGPVNRFFLSDFPPFSWWAPFEPDEKAQNFNGVLSRSVAEVPWKMVWFLGKVTTCCKKPANTSAMTRLWGRTLVQNPTLLTLPNLKQLWRWLFFLLLQIQSLLEFWYLLGPVPPYRRQTYACQARIHFRREHLEVCQQCLALCLRRSARSGYFDITGYSNSTLC